MTAAPVSRRAIIGVLVVALLLTAATLRFHLLGAQSLWHDEGNAYVQATRTFSDIATNAARDIHPPGYYWLLAIWHDLLGESEFALRSLSAFASLLSVALTYALGKHLYGSSAGLVAAGLVTLNTFSIYYAQEARMYALLALWGVASMWALAHLLRRPQSHWALALGLLNAAGLYTHYAFPFVMLAQGALFLLWSIGLIWDKHPKNLGYLGYYVGANVLALAIFAPWLPTAYDQVTNWPNTGAPIPAAEALSTIIAYFGFGVTVGGGTTITVLFLLLFGLLQLPTQSEASPDRRWYHWAALVPVVWVMLTVGVFLVLELFREANLKFLLPAQIGFALWIGRGVWVLWHVEVRRKAPLLRQVPKVAAVLTSTILFGQIATTIDALYTDPAHQRDDYRAIAALIDDEQRPGDAIILAAPNQQEVFGYYYGGETPVYPLPRGLGGDDDATLNETQQIIAGNERIFAVLWGTSERDPSGIVENTLDTQAFEASSTWYGDVRLVRYAAPVTFAEFEPVEVTFGESITLERYALNTREIRAGDVLQLQLQWTTDTPLDVNYKVFVQLLAPDGFLVAQRDAQPAGDTRPTSTWATGETIVDNHALIVPNDLPSAHYSLIVGLYNPNDPTERLPVGDGDYLPLGEIHALSTVVID